MKTFYQICFIVFAINCSPVFGQSFDSVYQLSNGNNDRNPRINYSHVFSFNLLYEYEMFVFERLFPDSSVHIYVQKINRYGTLDDALLLTQLTALPWKNTNPSIAYNPSSFSQTTPRYVLVVWQTNMFGGSNIYGRRYIEGQGWSPEFAIDSSSSRKFTPNVVCIDSTNFAITYRTGNDITYRRYNILTGTLSPRSNITPVDTFHCSNPYITVTNTNPKYLLVTYEREITPLKHSICYNYRPLSASDTSVWSAGDSIAFTGDNKNAGFNEGNIATYETNSAGNWQVRGAFINPGGSIFHHALFTQSGGDYSNFQGKVFFITDGGGPYGAYGVMEDVLLNWQFIKFFFWTNLELQLEISKLGDEIPLTMVSSSPIFQGPTCRRFWFIFNYSFSPTSQFESRIYGTWADNCVTSISQIGNEIPADFALHQNYPNPFNPSTKIKFDIPAKKGLVRLSIYNSLGQEVAVLVNEELSPGSYEYTFDGSDLSSGIYFYKIQSSDFNETKKMLLVK